ncbi:MAG: DUF4333 domain-containing protein [Actinomycetia bacterium]|nr:DUF4333 domain-containing protein [Actinomycetes bacterium]
MYVAGAAAAAALIVTAGCSGGIEITAGDDEITADEISSKAEDALGPKVSGDPSITCDEALDAKDGETTTCEMRVGDDPATYDVDVTLSMDGDDYNLAFRSDDYRPEEGNGTIFADEVASQAESSLGEKYGTVPEITCPDDLDAEVDATTRCVLGVSGDEEKYGMTVTVTGLDGSEYQLSFQVDETPLDPSDELLDSAA